MRTREKLRVHLKVKCGCGCRVSVGDATTEVGTKIDQSCKHCGAKIRRIISQTDLDAAIKEYTENKEFAGRLARGEVGETTRVDYFPKARKPLVREEPVAPIRKVRSDQVEGAAKLYHYAVYVKHPWGTDRIVVGIQKRNIQDARDAAYDKVGRVRKTGDLKIMDAVPMKWTTKGMVETRKTTVKTGNLKNARRPKSRPSSRATKQKVNGR
jgi:hypothetical protein